MKNKKKYVVVSGICGLILFLTSLPYLLKNYIAIPALNIYIQESHIYVFCIIFFPTVSVLCALITHKQEIYDYLDVIINCIVAFTLAMLLKSVDFAPVITLLAVIIFVILSLIYLIRERRKEEFTFLKYISKLRYLFALVFAIVMIPTFIDYVLVMSEKNFTVVDEPIENEEELTIAQIFSDEKWNEYTVEEKYEAVKYGINYLVKELRLEEITLKINDTPLQDTLHGSYSHNYKYIQISENYILTCEDPKKIFSTLCHESFHYYQYEMMDLYFEIAEADIDVSYPYFDKIREWVNGYNNYLSDKENYEDYLNNELEYDANLYAEEMIKKIFEE